METRVKIYKKYREQIKKEFEINEKLCQKNREIDSLEKKIEKYDDFFIEKTLMSNVNLIKPKLLSEIKNINEICDQINKNKIYDDLKTLEMKKGIIEHIIDKSGNVNVYFLNNNEQFGKMKNILKDINNFDMKMDNFNIILKDNSNIENNYIHELKSSHGVNGFLDLKEEKYKIPSGFKFSYFIFLFIFTISLVLFILIMIFIFI